MKVSTGSSSHAHSSVHHRAEWTEHAQTHHPLATGTSWEQGSADAADTDAICSPIELVGQDHTLPDKTEITTLFSHQILLSYLILSSPYLTYSLAYSNSYIETALSTRYRHNILYLNERSLLSTHHKVINMKNIYQLRCLECALFSTPTQMSGVCSI